MRKKYHVIGLVCAFLLGLCGFLPVVSAETEVGPEIEFPQMSADISVRANGIWQQLRCPVCQGQNIAESDALIAKRLRFLVVEELQSGKSDAQVIADIVTRYGDFIFFKPPLRGSTFLLWFGPLLFLGMLVLLASRRIKFVK